MGNPVGKRLLGISGSRWKDNIEYLFNIFRSGIVGWTGLIWLRMGTRGGFL